MGMRLLKKSEVFSLKAKEREGEIKQGVQLSKRVDALREVQANEVASLEAFRRSTIANIHAEIERENSKLEAIRGEYDKLQKTLLLGTDDLEKRAVELLAKEVKAQALIDEYEQKLVSLQASETIITKKLHYVSDQEFRASTRLEQAERALQEALVIKESAEALDRQVQTKVAQLAEDRANAEAQWAQQTQYYHSRMEVVLKRENSLDERESALTDRERQVNDRYNTLLQTEKYLK
jgi:chromosome segregation ATPase